MVLVESVLGQPACAVDFRPEHLGSLGVAVELPQDRVDVEIMSRHQRRSSSMANGPSTSRDDALVLAVVVDALGGSEGRRAGSSFGAESHERLRATLTRTWWILPQAPTAERTGSVRRARQQTSPRLNALSATGVEKSYAIRDCSLPNFRNHLNLLNNNLLARLMLLVFS